VGQYVNRGGKTYYKADDGKLYKNYNDALAVANQPQTGYEYGLNLLGIRPDRNAMSGVEYGMQQLKGLAGTAGKPETGLQYGLQLAGNLFNNFGRGAKATPQASPYTSISSDQLPPGAFMNEAGRVGGMTSEDAYRLGGYMDEMGRVFVPKGMGKPPAAPQLPPPAQPSAVIPAGTVQPAAIVSGLTPAGEVDRSQSDEYKSQMAQYRNLISQKKTQKAEDLGMQMWMEKYGGKLGLTGPNPLMQDFGGFVPTQGPTPAVMQASEAPLKAFGQEVKSYFPGAGPEGFSPLDAQDQQQEATADQADMATTVKLPVRNRVQAFLQGGM